MMVLRAGLKRVESSTCVYEGEAIHCPTLGLVNSKRDMLSWDQPTVDTLDIHTFEEFLLQ